MDNRYERHNRNGCISMDPKPIDMNRFRVVSRIDPHDLRFALDDVTASFLVQTMSALRSSNDDLNNDGFDDWSNLFPNTSSVASFPNKSSISTVALPLPTMTQRLAGQQMSRISRRSSLENKTKDSVSACPFEDRTSLHSHHKDLWDKRFRELTDYKRRYGDCFVPHNYALNRPLAKWVKRQRYQYKLKMAGKHSTLFDDRQSALEEIGFVWDYHSVVWQQKMNELIEFKAKHGHCNVPNAYDPNPQLAIWIQCQRRQYKLFFTDEKSYMTEDRIKKLNAIGFSWSRRRAG